MKSRIEGTQTFKLLIALTMLSENLPRKPKAVLEELIIKAFLETRAERQHTLRDMKQ